MQLIIADDHRLFLDVLENYLKMLQPDIEIAKAANFDEARELVANAHAADLAILDLNMTGMHGFKGLETMREQFPATPVVIISGQARSAEIREALRLGAAGFIPKDLEGKALLKALNLVLSGNVFVPKHALAEAPFPSPGNRQASAADNPIGHLTRRQQQVLTLAARGLTNKGIARELGVTEVTVAVHLGGAFRRLEASCRTEAVSKAIRLGMKV